MEKPPGYRSISIRDELVEQVEQLIQRLGTYRSIADFVSEAVRLRLEALEKKQKRRLKVEK